MNRQETIAFYRKNGMPVFPLAGKRPLKSGWKHTPVESLDAVTYGGNIGINLPRDIVVIDIDPRNFPKGSNPAAELYEACGLVKPDTLKVITGSGGLHIYFRKPIEVNCKKNLDKDGFPGIDIKTRNHVKGEDKGQFVVAPTSIHKDTGKEYVFTGTTTSIMDIPLGLLEIIRKPEVTEVQEVDGKSHPADYCDLGTGRELFVTWLRNEAPLAIEGSSGDETTFKVACQGRDYGLDVTNTYFCMQEYWNDRCEPMWDDDDLIIKVQNAFNHASGVQGEKNMASKFNDLPTEEIISIKWDMNKDKETLAKTLNNTVNFFNLPAAEIRNQIFYNEFTNRVEFVSKAPWHHVPGRKEWSDDDIVACRYYLSTKFGFEVQPKVIDEAAKIIAMKNRRHPVREYLESVVWDGVSRLNHWLPKYGKVPNNAFAREVGRKILVGAVARIYSPGCKFDYVTVLEGAQGFFKSTLVSVLGGEWYTEIDIDPRNKDIIQLMNGKWFIELSEMETQRKADADALKSFITRQTDRIRLPYDRYASDVPRQCLFIGTINPQVGIGYLKDTTGNRRFWCLEVAQHCDTEGLKKVRDQLFAEAVCVYRNGESLFIDKADVDEYAKAEADKRSGGDPWQSLIGKRLAEMALDKPLDVIAPCDIYTLCVGGNISDFDVRRNVRILKAMKALGWKHTVRDGPHGIKEEVFVR